MSGPIWSNTLPIIPNFTVGYNVGGSPAYITYSPSIISYDTNAYSDVHISSSSSAPCYITDNSLVTLQFRISITVKPNTTLGKYGINVGVPFNTVGAGTIAGYVTSSTFPIRLKFYMADQTSGVPYIRLIFTANTDTGPEYSFDFPVVLTYRK